MVTSVYAAYEQGLLTQEELAQLILAAAEREVRRDFKKQSGEDMLTKDYKFRLESYNVSMYEIVVVFEVIDQSIFSYRNWAVVYSSCYNDDYQLKSIIEWLEGEPYIVEIEDDSIKFNPASAASA